MNLKTIIQIFLILFTILITFLFFYKYFYIDRTSNELIDESLSEVISEKKDEEEIVSTESTDSIIEDLRFENIDINGNKIVIIAKYGEINTDNYEVLNLKKVRGIIYLINKSPINISSDFGRYNKINFDTIFQENVKISYEDNSIESEKFEISLNNNVASINGNVVFDNNYMVSYADNIELNLLNENIIINMFDKEDNIKINRK